MQTLLALYKWLTDRPSYMFLTASDERLDAQKPGRFTYVWIGLMGLSVLAGLMLVGVWALVWETFRDWDRLSRPAGVTAVVLVVWPLRRALVSIGTALGLRDRANQMAVAAAAAALIGVGFMSLVERRLHSYDSPWPNWIAWIRPEMAFFRVLLLMPVWGAWSMLITVQFRRPDATTDRITRRLVRGCGPLAAALCMVLPLAATIVYFHYFHYMHHEGWRGQTAIIGGTLTTAILSGPILCLTGRGLTRQTLLAANMITQIVFLMLCTIWL